MSVLPTVAEQQQPLPTDPPRNRYFYSSFYKQEEIHVVDHSRHNIYGRPTVIKILENQYKLAYAFYALVEMEPSGAPYIRSDWITFGKPDHDLPSPFLPLDSERFLPTWMVEDIVSAETWIPEGCFGYTLCMHEFNIAENAITDAERALTTMTAQWRYEVLTNGRLWPVNVRLAHAGWRRIYYEDNQRMWPRLRTIDEDGTTQDGD